MLSLDLGVTAAMANASAAVKDVCSVIAPSNDQDDVVFLIEDILEQKNWLHEFVVLFVWHWTIPKFSLDYIQYF